MSYLFLIAITICGCAVIHENYNDDTMMKNKMLVLAAQHNQIEMVKYLLRDELIDPALDDYSAFKIAAENGHYEMIETLLRNDKFDNFIRQISVFIISYILCSVITVATIIVVGL